jgi:hypothetical protein
MLLVRFMHLDSRDPDRECTLFVDLSQDDYKGEKLRLELGREIGLNLNLSHRAAYGYPQNLSLKSPQVSWCARAAALGL